MTEQSSSPDAMSEDRKREDEIRAQTFARAGDVGVFMRLLDASRDRNAALTSALEEIDRIASAQHIQITAVSDEGLVVVNAILNRLGRIASAALASSGSPASGMEEASSDAAFRAKYEPLIAHFVAWRKRLNEALELDPLGSMETAVAAVEVLAGEPTDRMLNAAQSRLCEMENVTHFNDRHQAEMFKAMWRSSRSKTAPAPSDAQPSMFKVSEALRIDDEAAP